MFGIGPAGTGKTYLAAAFGAHMLYQRRVERLILSRPALEAGERLGFLPGDLKEKIDPYLRPLYDALFDVLGEQTTRLMEQGVIEVAPLAFMRGRTLTRAFVILDEAQNTTAAQMKMVLTRLGEDSPDGGDGRSVTKRPARRRPEGLNEALSILEGVEGVGVAAIWRGRCGAPCPRQPHRRAPILRMANERQRHYLCWWTIRVGARRAGLCPRLTRAAAAARQGGRLSRVQAAHRAALAVTAGLKALNRDFRGKDKPTNVLSFPAAPNKDGYRGDIAMAYGVTRTRSRSGRQALSPIMPRHLVVHGVLHLAGYDHERARDAKVMEAAGSREFSPAWASPILMRRWASVSGMNDAPNGRHTPLLKRLLQMLRGERCLQRRDARKPGRGDRGKRAPVARSVAAGTGDAGQSAGLRRIESLAT